MNASAVARAASFGRNLASSNLLGLILVVLILSLQIGVQTT